MSKNRSRSSVRDHRMTAEDAAKLDELERLREEYLRKKKEEEEKEKERAAVQEYVIGIMDVEVYSRDNAKKHNTDAFEILSFSDPPLIVRRGQPFNIHVRFQREYDLLQDSIALQFTTGCNPRPNKGTLIRLPVTKNGTFTLPVEKWDVRLHQEELQIMHLQIQISCKAAVGFWKLTIISSNPKAPIPREYHVKKEIYILFNPWCKDDAVYMENETERNEYVLNEIGKIFNGTNKQPGSRRWVYGQFSTVVLPASVAILAKSTLDDVGRGSPIKVTRALSAILNDEDDNGVLEGKWRTPFDDGISPTQWTGSRDILERYVRSGFKTVRYGQCWVFAGLFTTVCRALGIPCRPVTNYASAHDTDNTLTIDMHFTSDGEKLENGRHDSVWNYHVWNDCWMTRPDLPSGYGGWQAVDSTPQETSEGYYQTGPCSVHAVKRGEVGYMYDAPFVFSEVNADIIHWQRDLSLPTGWRKIRTRKYIVGQFILTKKAGVEDYDGDNDKEDITDLYKNREATPEERLAIRNAATHGNYATTIFDMPEAGTEDVFFDMIEIDRIMIGQPFSVVVHVQNKSNERRSVTAALSVESVLYTGIRAHMIKHELQKIVLMPKQKEVLAVTITAEEYYDKLVDYSMMKIYAMASVEETKQTWTEEDDFAVEKPRLKLQVSQPLQVDRQFDLSITLKNPLLRWLQNCTFVIEGPGLAEPHRTDYRDIRPEETIVHAMSFVPKKTGKRSVFVVFNSDQLIDVQGSLKVQVV